MSYTPTNFRLAPRWAAACLERFFDQLEPALAWVSRLSRDDLEEMERDIREPVEYSKEWWDKRINAADGKAAALAYRDRIRRERAAGIMPQIVW